MNQLLKNLALASLLIVCWDGGKPLHLAWDGPLKWDYEVQMENLETHEKSGYHSYTTAIKIIPPKIGCYDVKVRAIDPHTGKMSTFVE